MHLQIINYTSFALIFIIKAKPFIFYHLSHSWTSKTCRGDNWKSFLVSM